jgi:hypothetical protein
VEEENVQRAVSFFVVQTYEIRAENCSAIQSDIKQVIAKLLTESPCARVHYEAFLLCNSGINPMQRINPN